MSKETSKVTSPPFEDFKQMVINDYQIAMESREASLLGRKEVLTGKAKFGIFGDGKEVAQLAMARSFKDGDFRSGYYRDQTFMFATGNLTIQQWFAGLYAHADVNADPTSGGRQMGGHFATRSLNDDGTWKNLTQIKNSSADISPTAGQMPRLLGLAQASKIYRNVPGLEGFTNFSNKKSGAGVQSWITQLNAFLGTIVKTFIHVFETKDSLLIGQSLIGLLLNGTLLIQILLMQWSDKNVVEEKKLK